MRCLYCGNELALLKKLTGHGEFCSEAHRQKYQEQFSRLALTRLLQAEEPLAERPPLQLSTRPGSPPRPALQPGAEIRQIEPPASPPPSADALTRSADIPTHSADAPPASGFLPHHFEPALSPSELFSLPPFLGAVTACLPGLPPMFGLPSETWADERPASPSAMPRRISSGMLGLSEGMAPLPLTLQTVPIAPVVATETAYQFEAEYQGTLGMVASDIIAVLPEVLAEYARPGAAAR